MVEAAAGRDFVQWEMADKELSGPRKGVVRVSRRIGGPYALFRFGGVRVGCSLFWMWVSFGNDA